MLTKFKRIFTVLRFGFLVVRYAGFRLTIQKLGHQIYSKTLFLGQITGPEAPSHPANFPCIVVPASPEDIEEFFSNIKNESRDGKYQLIVRKWYHEIGFGMPYVTKTLDTNEVCHIAWMVTSDDQRSKGFDKRFPRLKENEVMLENLYTIERFRRQGVQTSWTHQMNAIRLSKGLIWNKGYQTVDNIAELRFAQQRGTKIFEKVLERHFLFHVTRKTIETYDPPIPITDEWFRD